MAAGVLGAPPSTIREVTTTTTNEGSGHAGHRRLLVLAAVLLLALGAAACGSGTTGAPADRAAGPSTTAAAPSTLLDPAAFEQYLAQHPGVPVVNVHIPYAGEIAGTTDLVPFDQIGTWAGLPADHAAPLALYCRSGNMSAEASSTLAAMGYTNLVELSGGMNAWTASGRTLPQS